MATKKYNISGTYGTNVVFGDRVDLSDGIKGQPIVMTRSIPVDTITSAEHTWIGEFRDVSTGETTNYTTTFPLNNQHLGLKVNSLTGSGIVTVTGLAVNESTGLPTAGETEAFTIDATGYYQSLTKWFEITDISFAAGITVINYDVEVIGYVDFQNSDVKMVALRADIHSGGVNSNIALEILKVSNLGGNKVDIVTLEDYGVDVATKSVIDGLRTGGDDRSLTTTGAIWANDTNFTLKQSDYSTYFSSGENEIEGSNNEGLIIRITGTGVKNINNVALLNMTVNFVTI